jgi:UDP-2-acetamido-3-amino-2,3-dideoxy-glucuronate N-acetyltransferase
METSNRIAPDVSLGRSVKIFGFANLYGCTVGDESRIGYFVEIQKNATVSRCALQNFEPLVYLRRRHYRGRRIYWSSRVLHQRSVSACVPAGRNFANGRRLEGDSHCGQTTRDDWVGAVILGGITIGAGAIVGAGAVVTKSVAPRTVVAGNPARLLRRLGEKEAP